MLRLGPSAAPHALARSKSGHLKPCRSFLLDPGPNFFALAFWSLECSFRWLNLLTTFVKRVWLLASWLDSLFPDHGLDDHIVLDFVTVEEQFVLQLLAHREEADLLNCDRARIRRRFDERKESVLGLLDRAQVGAGHGGVTQLLAPYFHRNLFLFGDLLGQEGVHHVVNVVVIWELDAADWHAIVHAS